MLLAEYPLERLRNLLYCMKGLCLLWPEMSLVWPEMSLVWLEITVSLKSLYIDVYTRIHTCTHIYMALWHS
jgi:hypothetical protein